MNGALRRSSKDRNINQREINFLHQTIFLMRFSLLSLCLIWITCSSYSQPKEGLAKELDELNKSIDRAVVKKDFETLQKLYADDFVFTHATGHVDSKESWIKDIQSMG